MLNRLSCVFCDQGENDYADQIAHKLRWIELLDLVEDPA